MSSLPLSMPCSSPSARTNSPKSILNPLYGLGDKHSILKTSFNHTRSTEEIGFTITHHGYRIGEHNSSLQLVDAEHHLPLLTYHRPVYFPPTWTREQKMQHLCNMVPPDFAGLLAQLLHNSMSPLGFASFTHNDLLPDIVAPSQEPRTILRRLPPALQLPDAQRLAHINVLTKDLSWLSPNDTNPCSNAADILDNLHLGAFSRQLPPPTSAAPAPARDKGPPPTSTSTDPSDSSSPPLPGVSFPASLAPRSLPLSAGAAHSTYQPQSYHNVYGQHVPWKDAKVDQHGNPEPLQPPHTRDHPHLRVATPSDAELNEAMKILKVPENEYLNDAERLLVKHLVSYTWALFDGKMRGINCPPIELRFSDPRQQPIKKPPYRLSPSKMACLRKQVDEWTRDGIIEPASSPWSFPALLLDKKGATPGTSDAYRLAVDFRQLNSALEDDSFPTTHPDDVFQFLGQGAVGPKRYRSTIDARWGFHLLPISDKPVVLGRDPRTGDPMLASYSSRDACTFSTPIGCYSYKRLPLGIRPASAMFNRQVTTDLAEFLYKDLISYLDDVSIAHDSKEAHLIAIIKILVVMANKGYSIKLKKFLLLQLYIEILGHISTPDGLKPSPRTLEAITKMPVPGSVPGTDAKAQIRSFMGLASWARRYIKNFAKIVAPLRKLTELNVPFKWTEDCQAAWDAVVNALVTSKGIHHPDWTKDFYVRTDASKQGLGAYLFYLETIPDDKGHVRKEERVIAYWSRSVPKECQNYDTRRLELMAVILALEHFRLYIEGHPTHLESDHKNLTYLRNNKHSSGQLARWAMRLEQFNSSIKLRYLPGKNNPVADCLSRNPEDRTAELEDDPDLDPSLLQAYLFISEIHDDTKEAGHATFRLDPAYVPEGSATPTTLAPEQFLDGLSTAITREDIRLAQADCPLTEDCHNRIARSNENTYPCPFIVKDGILCKRHHNDDFVFVLPEPLRERAIELSHEGALQGHTGAGNTYAHLKDRYWWPNSFKDVQKYVQRCVTCRKARTGKPHRQGLLQQPPRVGDLHLLGMDLFGPLPRSDGHRYILVYYDQFSHYLILDVIDTKEDMSILRSFVNSILLKGHLPVSVTFDQGSEFKNRLFTNFLTQFEVRYSAKLTYNPQSHHTERVNRFIKAMLKSLIDGCTIAEWPTFTRYVEFVYNTKCLIPGTNLSPHQLRFGRPAKGPADLNLLPKPVAFPLFPLFLTFFTYDLLCLTLSACARKDGRWPCQAPHLLQLLTPFLHQPLALEAGLAAVVSENTMTHPSLHSCILNNLPARRHKAEASTTRLPLRPEILPNCASGTPASSPGPLEPALSRVKEGRAGERKESVSLFVAEDLRHSKAPHELEVAEKPLHTLPRSRREFYDALVSELRTMETAVKKAHEDQQARQKLNYDADHTDVTFHPGDLVLRYVHKTDNKLRMEWTGPYQVISTPNPAVLVIRDAFDTNAPPHTVSIRDVTPTTQPRANRPPYTPTPSPPPALPQGKFVLFRLPRRDRPWKSQIHVAEIYQSPTDDDKTLHLHLYCDFGANDDPRNDDPEADLRTRKVSPVFMDPATSKVFTAAAARTPASKPLVRAFLPHEVDLVSPPFDLYGHRIPPRIATNTYARVTDRPLASRKVLDAVAPPPPSHP
eukprot:CAMPEP_0197410896 /NCGR_PEP_ID=MMETSP1165-20131217/31689_1 /TAXON_ID=284809 /ORGANISM="Chrysocystis fragilis, Strain CCMP3189" /LENGTH=1632 /DNA_ID=CAMNT_0042937407 /DNA_START=41 /DNA_END=4942 /DNA_ORIENTATION=+